MKDIIVAINSIHAHDIEISFKANAKNEAKKRSIRKIHMG
jgi:hypothetical protein